MHASALPPMSGSIGVRATSVPRYSMSMRRLGLVSLAVAKQQSMETMARESAEPIRNPAMAVRVIDRQLKFLQGLESQVVPFTLGSAQKKHDVEISASLTKAMKLLREEGKPEQWDDVVSVLTRSDLATEGKASLRLSMKYWTTLPRIS